MSADVSTVLACKKIAADPLTRTRLLQDSASVGFLVLVLSNNDPSFRKAALETLILLSDTAKHRAYLSRFLGMEDQVVMLLERYSVLQCTTKMSADVSTVLACKKIAADPLTRTRLLQDSASVGFLVLVLSNNDPSFRKAALETLILLSDTAKHRAYLSRFLGMEDQVVMLLESDNNEIQTLAKQLHKLLYEESHALKDSKNTRSQSCRKETMKKKGGFFIAQGRSKTVVLQIKGLKDKTDMEICRSHLLEVKGVISITFDMVKKRAILRTKVDMSEEVLARAIAKSDTMSAEQVVKGPDGEEFISFGAGAAAPPDKENLDLPQYLPDEDSPAKDSHSLARLGQANKAKGWLSAAASYISNTFYW
ncbi:armadillo repeat-containing protein 1 [Lingula anatina]|uniref:Armadillo repeat-containing protein 1 n=1 Tax=Lingula anatina TaxID=7574 RepID=A0A1S3JWG4_LINAN|nr:armadillo repeat-containing protein 1 [Lingula anatina]|eukprot:XP_013414406.1 armadillo repeat-containing protein 1 [Lingula anatina]